MRHTENPPNTNGLASEPGVWPQASVEASAGMRMPGAQALPSDGLQGRGGLPRLEYPVAAGRSEVTGPAPGHARAQGLKFYDSHSRAWRLRLAVGGMFGMVILAVAMALLRNYKLSQHPAQAAGSSPEGLAGNLIHTHTYPSYTLVFLAASLAIMILGVVFAVATHDPFDPRLRVAERRVEHAVKDFDGAVKKHVLEHLAVEQKHLAQGALAPHLLQIQRQRHRRWNIVDWTERKDRKSARPAERDDSQPEPSSLGPLIDALMSVPTTVPTSSESEER
jgi:hypothetical protein